MPNGDGFGFGFDPSAFFAGILAAIEAVINAIISALVFLFNLLVFAANFLLNGLLTVAKYLLDGFKVLLRGLKHVLSDIFHGRFKHLFEDYLKLKETLKRWFGPLLKWLQRIRKWFDLYVLRPMKIIVNIIQRIRQILVIFRIFHFKFAEKLDAFLARVESKLVKNVLFLRKVLNQVISLIDILVDPSLIFRRNVVGATLLSWLGAVKRIVGFGSNRALGADEVDSIEKDKALLKPGTTLVTRTGNSDPVFHPALARIMENIDRESKDFLPSGAGG